MTNLDRTRETEKTRMDISQRLDVLAKKIAVAKAHIDQERGPFTSQDRQKAEQIEARYQILKQKLDDDVANAEAHGHHVSTFEKTVMDWINSLDSDL